MHSIYAYSARSHTHIHSTHVQDTVNGKKYKTLEGADSCLNERQTEKTQPSACLVVYYLSHYYCYFYFFLLLLCFCYFVLTKHS